MALLLLLMSGGGMRAKGFSLIELMIVIGVIAVINIVMIPNYTSLQRSAKQISSKSSARTLMVALEQYYFIHQDYPPGTNIGISSLFSELKSNELISKDPINPYTGQPYSLQDNAGQILYSRFANDAYQLKGYNYNNQEVLFEYP